MSGVAAWTRFVEQAGRDVRELEAGVLGSGSATRAELAAIAFRVALASLLVGAEDVGRVALAIERAIDAHAGDDAALRSRVGEPARALVDSLVQLENADKSGARVEGIPLAEIAATLEAGLPAAERAAAPRPRPPPTVPPPATSAMAGPAFQWAPAIDEDMIELFFDEATERIEGISGKLLDLERASSDPELLGALFRDLHTVKGSSAMVGLEPMNRLAHAAEDLVGQLREGTRAADAAVVNALLATLDGLRRMLDLARTRSPIAVDPAPLVRALRDPGAAVAMAAQPMQAAAPAPHEAAPATSGEAPAQRQTIRVDFDKLDRLMNLVGELVLGRDGLRTANAALASAAAELSTDRALAKKIAARRGAASQDGRTSSKDLTEELGRVERVLGSVASDLDASTGQLDSISAELRDQVMRLRMIPVGGIFRKHQRTLRDLGQALGKRVHLELSGENTELDKLLVEALDEPLLHLVRNAVDHGVESPTDRERAGKPPEGTVRLSAFQKGNQVIIRIADDGRGMDPERLKSKAIEKGVITAAEAASLDARGAFDLIFRAGFSTAATVSDVSGRGVGMDVVRQTIVTRLKGTIDVESSPGLGSAFVLRLPLTLAIMQVLLANVCGETFAIPLDGVSRTVIIAPDEVRLVGDREVIEIDGRTHPLVRLASVLELEGHASAADEPLMIVLTEQSGDVFGVACDRLLGKKEIVIKSLGELLAGVPCASGATILGDRCALILDIPSIVQRALRRPPPRREVRALPTGPTASILLVDDSDTVRESLRRLLVDAGYQVTTAEDGRAALAIAKSRRFDLVSTDVMMPHMDGYDLTRALRALPEYHDTPIVMVTSRGERIDRVRGFDAGVDDYITKPHDRQLLLQSVKKLLGHDKEPA